MMLISVGGIGVSVNLLDERSEVGTSSMIMFITLIIASAIISVTMVSATELMFAKQKDDASNSGDSFGGIIYPVILQVTTLGATDTLLLTFELHYIQAQVPDVNVGWTFLCPAAGSIQFDSGDFSLATTLAGDGNTAGQITEFIGGEDYIVALQLSNCDVDTLDTGTLVLMMLNGRVSQTVLDLSSAVVGMELI